VVVKVDELLANIRKNVDADLDSLSGGTAGEARGTLMRGALREMRVAMTEGPTAPNNLKKDISDLRSRIRAKMDAMEQERAAAPPPLPPSRAVVPARNDFSGILSAPAEPAPRLRNSYADEPATDDVRYAAHPGWQQPGERRYAQAEDPGYDQPDPYAAPYGYEEAPYDPYAAQADHRLVSPQTEAHAENAFQQLSDALLARATGDRSLEEMTREMLRTMLRQWLDANLPAIVEDMVREEIQRVARRGR
jgi:uncharacterized protein